MSLPEIVNSLPRHLRGSWFIVRRFKKRTTNHQPSTINRNSTGFTLIELLVVISIIAILMAVASVSYLNAQQKGRDNKRKSDLKAIQQALEIYYNQNGIYPAQGTGATSNKAGRIKCNKPGGVTTVIEWGSVFTCDNVTFMSPTPKDPANAPNTDRDYYYDATSTSSYILSAKLENTNDQDNADRSTYPGNPTLPCTPKGYISPNPSGSTKNYCVVNP